MKKILLMALVGLFITTNTNVNAAFPVKTEKATTVVSAAKAEKNQKAELKAAKEEANSEMATPAAAGGGKSQLVALLLCIFVGGLGIHRFYLGYIWQGIVQLLTGGGCGIWALIDLIRIITGSLKPKDGDYGTTL